MAEIGHNSKSYGGIEGSHLRQYIEQIERLSEEKQGVQENIKDVFGEAKAIGFDVKIMRKVISIRKMDSDKAEEEETLLDLYKHALGMIPSDK